MVFDLEITAELVIPVILGVVAIAVSIYTLTVQIRHNRRAMRPLADFNLTAIGAEMRLSLINEGLGPMFVRNIELVDCESKQVESFESVFCNFELDNYTRRTCVNGILKAGSAFLLIDIRFVDRDNLLHAMSKLSRMKLRIDYRDIHDIEYKDQMGFEDEVGVQFENERVNCSLLERPIESKEDTVLCVRSK